MANKDTENKCIIIVGMDFGTSFSQTAVCHEKEIIDLNERGDYGVPSVFFYSSTDGVVVGKEALKLSKFDPDNLIREIKMRLNEQQITIDAREFSSNEIVSYIYKELINSAKRKGPENIIGFELGGAVITHPAKFQMTEINALCESARNCLGADETLPIVGALKEPVAAAIAYFDKTIDSFETGDGILVFDFGGGTTDIALVKVNKSDDAQYEVVESEMERVGGRDFDKALFNYAKTQIELLTQGEIKIDGNKLYEDDLYTAVVEAKHALSKNEQTAVRCLQIHHREIKRGIPITRDEFTNLTEDLLEQALMPLFKMYQKHKDTVNIKAVVCVGGSSNMPQVYNQIVDAFPNCRVCRYRPETAVARGAAIFGDKIVHNLVKKGYGMVDSDGNVVELPKIVDKDDPNAPTNLVINDVVQDILAHSYGIRCKKHPGSKEWIVKNLLKKGQKFPAEGKHSDFGVTSSAKAIRIEVYESECMDDQYDCDGTHNEKEAGYFEFVMPKGVDKKDKIACVLTAYDLTTLRVDAENLSTNEKDGLEFKVNNV